MKGTHYYKTYLFPETGEGTFHPPVSGDSLAGAWRRPPEKSLGWMNWSLWFTNSDSASAFDRFCRAFFVGIWRLQNHSRSFPKETKVNVRLVLKFDEQIKHFIASRFIFFIISKKTIWFFLRGWTKRVSLFINLIIKNGSSSTFVIFGHCVDQCPTVRI